MVHGHHTGAQRFFKNNQDELVSAMQLDFERLPEFKIPEKLYVNLSNNQKIEPINF